MKRRFKPAEQEHYSVPGYIVTFSDMVTLLLTFFVLLLTLADVQDPELFNRGRDSFWQSIRYCGLGPLLGKDTSIDLGATKIRYLTDDPRSRSETRSIDATREKIRRIFERISRSVTTLPSQLLAERTSFSVTNIRFPPSQAALDESAKKFLTEFGLSLKQNLTSEATTLYVLGLAGDQETHEQQWILSARRARAVADFLEQSLSEQPGPPTAYGPFLGPRQWNVLWWGAGPGGNWAGQDHPVPKQSQILIAVLKPGD